MVTLTCGDSTHRTGECTQPGEHRRPCVTNPKNSAAKNSKTTRRDHAQDVAVLMNCSGLGPARPTLATVAVDPFFLTRPPDFRAPRPDALSTAMRRQSYLAGDMCLISRNFVQLLCSCFHFF